MQNQFNDLFFLERFDPNNLARELAMVAGFIMSGIHLPAVVFLAASVANIAVLVMAQRLSSKE